MVCMPKLVWREYMVSDEHKIRVTAHRSGPGIGRIRMRRIVDSVVRGPGLAAEASD